MVAPGCSTPTPCKVTWHLLGCRSLGPLGFACPLACFHPGALELKVVSEEVTMVAVAGEWAFIPEKSGEVHTWLAAHMACDVLWCINAGSVFMVGRWWVEWFGACY